jgi:hypothetical protein
MVLSIIEFSCRQDPPDPVHYFQIEGHVSYANISLSGKTVILERNGQAFRSATTDHVGYYKFLFEDNIDELDSLVLYAISTDTLEKNAQIFRFTSADWPPDIYAGTFQFDANFSFQVFSRLHINIRNVNPFDNNDRMDTLGETWVLDPSLPFQFYFTHVDITNLTGTSVDTIIDKCIPRTRYWYG